MNKIEIGLWRDKPPVCSLRNDELIYPISRIFPSGRQALTFALEKVGFERSKRVALPEWSSHCVISSVGKVATPIPVNEVIKYKLKVDAILLYEQWGWPFQPELKSKLLEFFENSIIILDRVDSADIDNEKRIKFYPEADQIEIISFSKILGLPGGGLAKLNGEYLTFKPDLNDEKISSYIWKGELDKANFLKLNKIHKSYFRYLHPELLNWLSKSDLIRALQNECKIRQENLSLLIDSSLSSDWPEWMIQAHDSDVSPGIVPLFKNKSEKILKKAYENLIKFFGVETSKYHFNWSGDPLNPQYESVLAFPIHGMIKGHLSNIIDYLIDLVK